MITAALALGAVSLHAQEPGPDVTPPVITCPPDYVEWSADPEGQAVFFDPPVVTDNADPAVFATFVPESGSHFPMGETLVTCTAKDASGNQSQCTFKVTVMPPKLVIEVKNGRVSLLNECLWNVQTTFDLAPDNWDPLYDPPAPGVNPKQFFRLADPKQNPGIDYDLASGETITYVATGLMQDWYRNGEEGGAHMGPLLWAQDDRSTVGGSVVLQPPPDVFNFTNRWSGVINLPFKFHFYGKSFTRCCVAWNGLLTFDTSHADSNVNDLFAGFPADAPTELATAPLPNPNLPNYTICGFYTNAPNAGKPEQQPVRAFLLGAAPRRQVWFVYPGDVIVKGTSNGILPHTTRRAIVLEEGTNRVLIVDMFDENHEYSAAGQAAAELEEEGASPPAETTLVTADSHRYVIGIQKNRTAALSIPASPKAAFNNTTSDYKDNDYYDFTPRVLAPLVQGTGHGSLKGFDARPLAYLASRNIPGATVAAAKGGRMVYNKGFGHARLYPFSIPMRPDHRTCIGSTSKIFTTMGLFRLIEEGKLTLADLEKNVYQDPDLLGTTDILKAIDEGVLTDNEVARINTVNLRHLLSHTAMIQGSGDTWATSVNLGIPFDDVTYNDVIVNFLSSRNLVTTANPGAVKFYSNQGLGQVGWLTGLIAKREYGQGYDDYLQDHVLKPIGNHHMRGLQNFIYQETSSDAYRYLSYTRSTVLPHADSRIHGSNGPRQYEQAWNTNNGAGGWTGTAADLVRLMCAQDGLNTHADRISASLRQEMHSRPFGDVAVGIDGLPTAAHAHGWVYDPNTESLSHNGNIFYGSSYMVMIPNDGVIDGNLNWNHNSLAIAVCFNTGDVNAAVGIANELRDLLDTLIFPPWYDLHSTK